MPTMINRSLRFKSITSTEWRHVLALMLSLVIFTTSESATRRTTKLKNSLIYYISSPHMMGNSMAMASHYGSQIRVPVRTTLPQTTSSLIANPYAYSYSTYYKLPIQFVSNAKPIDILKGITKSTTKKVVSNGYRIPPSKMSNLIYLPINYLSNSKPIKVIINPFTKT